MRHVPTHRHGWLLWAGVLAAVLALWSSGRQSVAATGGNTSRPALTVTTVSLRQEQWTPTLTANGSILPWQEAIIGAQLPGVRIAEVRVSLGDWVKRGQVLATLDNALRPSGESLPQGKIVAPDDGVISVVNATVGSLPKPERELFRLIRRGILEWRAELTAEELLRLRRGMRATITLSDGRTVGGTVRALSPSVDMQTRFGQALVRLDDSRGIIAGMFARGSFDLSQDRRSVLTLPQSSVLQRGNASYVLVVDASSRVHERSVVVGERNGDRVEIKQGLQVGERVVESGGAFLTEGDVVQVVER